MSSNYLNLFDEAMKTFDTAVSMDVEGRKNSRIDESDINHAYSEARDKFHNISLNTQSPKCMLISALYKNLADAALGSKKAQYRIEDILQNGIEMTGAQEVCKYNELSEKRRDDFIKYYKSIQELNKEE